MAKYSINELIERTNIYTLDLNDKLVQQLYADVQEGYFNEQGRTIPHIDLDTLIEILAHRGDLEEINTDRAINHKTPLEPFEEKKRGLLGTLNWSLYNVVLGMINDYTWSSSQIKERDSYVDDWYGELDDEEED